MSCVKWTESFYGIALRSINGHSFKEPLKLIVFNLDTALGDSCSTFIQISILISIDENRCRFSFVLQINITIR